MVRRHIVSLAAHRTSQLIEVFTVQPHEIETWAGRLLPHLERFELETQRTDALTLLRQAARAERQLWGVRSDAEVIGVLVTEIYDTTHSRVCWIWAAAGTESQAGDMQRVYEAIERWAREMGCKSIGINGRKGWLRVLPGFKQTAVVMEKEL